MSEQLDILSWVPPAPKKKRRKSSSENDDTRPCGCGLNVGRGYAWRDETGVDHIECEACLSPPPMPYWRLAPTPYPGSIGAAIAREAQ